MPQGTPPAAVGRARPEQASRRTAIRSSMEETFVTAACGLVRWQASPRDLEASRALWDWSASNSKAWHPRMPGGMEPFMANVAFLGLGVMGYPMAGHLKAKGQHTLTVYNRSTA